MANKRDIKCLMTNQEKNLIMNSSICEHKPNLKEVLQQFDKCIDKKDLDIIKKISEEVYKIIMTRDAVLHLKDASSKEWYPSKHLGIIKEPCQLCGSKKSEDKFLISNRIIDSELKVGTSCIGKFDKFENTLKGITLKEYAKLAKDNPKVLEKIVKFTEIYPRGKFLFYDWKSKYDSYEILFPKQYDTEFNRIVKGAEKLYFDYTRSKIDEKEINKINNFKIDFDYLIKKCNSYNDEYKYNKYRCTKKIATWLKNNNYMGTLNHIREKGLIEEQLAKYIRCVDFVGRFEDEIKNAFSKLKFKLESINDSYLEFSYVFSTFDPIFFVIPISQFTNTFYKIFYGRSDYDSNKLMNLLSVKNEYHNIYEYLGILNILIKDNKYYFEIRRDKNNIPVVELFKKGTNKIANVKMDRILCKYVNSLYLSEEKAKDYIMGLINEETWVNKEDESKYDIGNISSVWQN